MTKIKFHIQSQSELVLDEDAKQGDIIDLTSEQNIDTSIISDKIADIIAERVAQGRRDWEKQQQIQTDVKIQAEVAKKESELSAELSKLKSDLTHVTEQNEGAIKLKLNQQELTFKEQLAQRENKITELSSQLENTQQSTDLKLKVKLAEKDSEIKDVLSEKETEVRELKNELLLKEKEQALEANTIKQQYEVQLRTVQDQVEFYKDFKARQSTKEIGESLEQYALNEFEKVRMIAFPNAYFAKDNEIDARGSKGDFIFRDYVDELEFISIMFDMKNEADTTATKHKNTDFFAELDRDRQSKGTEYAVLVSMLESDNDLYNTGIVQVHEYEKMYVIRPQFFIQFIGLLRNAAMNTVQYQQDLAQVREQNIDVTNFENELNDFKARFGKNYASAATHFQKAIDEIDKSIARMEAIKKELTTSENQLRLANNKLDDVSIKRLTKNNPTMTNKFASL